MAAAAGVSVPTLRHYFGDKNAVLAAVFADCRAGGARELLAAATPTGVFRKSVRDLVRHVAEGFRQGGLDRLHAVGLAEGFAERHVARAYLMEILEPTIDAAASRLEEHIRRGDMRSVCPRHAAFALLAPIILLFLHQKALDGSSTHPADVDAALDVHADGFARGYAATPSANG
jgi:AcrR family transcriptional regulator